MSEKEKSSIEPPIIGSSEVSSAPAQPATEQDSWSAYLRIFSYAGSFERSLQVVAALAAFASGAAVALQNLIFGQFVTISTDFATGKSTPASFRNDAARFALFFVYIGIARFVLSYIYNSLLNYASARIVRNIRHAYLRAALGQEAAFHDLGSAGSIATQATSNGRLIQAGISEKLGLTFQGLSVFVTAFIIAFIVHWKLTLICLSMAVSTILVMAVVATIEAGYETKILDVLAQGNAFAEGILSSPRTVHAFEMRSRLVAKFDEYLHRTHILGRKLSPLLGILFSAEYTIIYLGIGLAFWQGIHMLARGDIENTGDIFKVLLSVVIAAISLTALAPYSIDFSRAASAAAKIFALIDRQSEIDPFDRSGAHPSEALGQIDFENVTFAYPTRPGVTVMDNFTLRFPAGKMTALVGPSGSGKSTVVGLIERWYNPKSGAIKLDGQIIDKLNLKWLRRTVRLVQQEPVLFQGTVFDNIRHGLTGTPWENSPRDEQMSLIQEAAQLAFAHDFITALPQGYDTPIGQCGGLLSGGQKQRIAIARSVVSKPKILLLDEATSALDPHAEGIVQAALDKAAEGRTTIVIAHKLATIRKADNIVVMSKGCIVEQGTHEELIANDSVYSGLVKIQDLQISSSSGDSNKESDDDEAAVAKDGKDEIVGLTKSLTRYPSSVRGRMEAQKERDNFENHQRKGFFAVLARLVMDTPELMWSYIFVVVGCAMAASALPGQAILLARTVDVFTLQGSAMTERGDFFASMFIVLAAGTFIAYFLLGYFTNIMAQHFSHKFRKESLDNMLRQDLQFFDRDENNIGALASRVDSNPQSILELMSYNVGLILLAALTVGACGIVAIAHDWKLGLVVVFAGFPPLLGAGFLKIRFDAKLDRDTAKRYAASASIASEHISAIRTVSSLTIEEEVVKKYTNELDTAVANSDRQMFLIMAWFALTQSIEYWFMALGFWYGCRLLSFGDISMYNFYVAFLAVFFSGQAASQLFQFSTSITKGINAANYIFWLHDLQPSITTTPQNKNNGPRDQGSPHICFENVRFSYPMRPLAPVLRGVNLNIQPSQFIALVGASGCGKSTMIALLERFYDPSTGTISIGSPPDSSHLCDLDPSQYRAVVSLVQQEPILFPGTIRENVALGLIDSSASSSFGSKDSAIESALRTSNAWTFVSSLPDGLNTSLGSTGSTQLSGGQKQRIAIARALIRAPKVLLLDEATSALDTESEKMVQRALADARRQQDGRDGPEGNIQNMTTIAVAHRLSTVKDADAIYVFFDGRIVEAGTHAELIQQGGIYKSMCEAQALD